MLKLVRLQLFRMYGREKMLSVMLLVAFMIVDLVALFTYGAMMEWVNDGVASNNDVEYFRINVKDDQCITYGQVKDALKKLDDSIPSALDNIEVRSYLGKETTDTYEGFMYIFSLDDDKNPAYYEMSKQSLTYGRWYTEDEFNSGAKVAVGSAYREENMGEQNIYTMQYEKDKSGDSYEICGDTYKCIGHALLWTTPIMPVTTLSNEERISRIMFGPRGCTLSYKEYYNIKSTFESVFGDAIECEYVEISDIDTKYYIYIFMIEVIMVVISMLILALLYSFFAYDQKKLYKVYMIVGGTRISCVYNFIVSNIIQATFVYVIVSLLFDKFVKVFFARYMRYYNESYEPVVYIEIFLIIIIVTIIIAAVCGTKEINKNLKE